MDAGRYFNFILDNSQNQENILKDELRREWLRHNTETVDAENLKRFYFLLDEFMKEHRIALLDKLLDEHTSDMNTLNLLDKYDANNIQYFKKWFIERDMEHIRRINHALDYMKEKRKEIPVPNLHFETEYLYEQFTMSVQQETGFLPFHIPGKILTGCHAISVDNYFKRGQILQLYMCSPKSVLNNLKSAWELAMKIHALGYWRIITVTGDTLHIEICPIYFIRNWMMQKPSDEIIP